MGPIPLLVAALFLPPSWGAAQPADAGRARDALTGDARARPDANPQCRLFRPGELVPFVGLPLGAGRNAGGGSGCQWVSADDEAEVMVTVVGARHHEAPTRANGYRALAEVGQRGFVVPELGGWTAGAIVGDEAIRVSVTGPKATAQGAIGLLGETIARRRR